MKRIIIGKDGIVLDTDLHKKVTQSLSCCYPNPTYSYQNELQG